MVKEISVVIFLNMKTNSLQFYINYHSNHVNQIQSLIQKSPSHLYKIITISITQVDRTNFAPE